MISICIPSYNRPTELIRLLNSIKFQNGYFEIIIAEDLSPKRDEVVEAVTNFIKENPSLKIHLHLNQSNLGYDGNLRNLIRLANGDFCLFMGDDDLMKENAIENVENAIKDNLNIGFILRSWDEIDLKGNQRLIQRYYARDMLFPPGEDTVVEFYRKSVFISGLVIHKESAIKYETDLVDGKLLYQLYLVSNILLDKSGYYLSETIATHVNGGEHFFGSSDKEKGKFEPKTLTVDHSLNFMSGFIEIARLIDKERKTNLRTKIIKDLSKYSYGFLVIQRGNGINKFVNYINGLKKLGYGKTLYFYVFSFMLLIFGEKLSERIISFLKSRTQSIPKL